MKLSLQEKLNVIKDRDMSNTCPPEQKNVALNVQLAYNMVGAKISLAECAKVWEMYSETKGCTFMKADAMGDVLVLEITYPLILDAVIYCACNNK